MLTETSVVGSDDWWLMHCATEMGAGFPRLGNLKKYRDGDAPVPVEATAAMRIAYTSFVKRSRLVMTDLIVDAKVNREKAVGFRTAAVGDDIGDTEAWMNWKRSHMQVGSRRLLRDVGHYGTAYLQVTGSTKPGKGAFADKFSDPTMIPSNGWTTFSSQLATRPWLAETVITVGYDPLLKADTIILFRPGYMRTAYRPAEKSTIPNDGSAWTPGSGWDWESGPIQLGFTADVPIVRLDGPDGMGLYEKHLDTVDRINETIKQRSTVLAMQAFRQRAIKGDLPKYYPDDDPRAGEEVNYDEIFKAGPAALWLIPTGADIWESAVTDITPILSATKDDTKNLAAVTSTPLYVLSPDAAAGSATGADLARESLKFSVEELNDLAGDAFATAHGLMFEAQRDATRADPAEIETIWAPVADISIKDRAAAAPQARAGGMPQRMVDEKIFGLTPAEQRQARQDRQDEAFDTPVVDIPPTAPIIPSAPGAPAAVPAPLPEPDPAAA